MEVGIFARTFPRPTLGEALDAVAASGIATIQFNLALASPLPSELAPEVAGTVREAVACRGLRMAAVSGTWNMAHPDPAVRADGARRLAVLIEAAPLLGTRVVTLCTGTRDADDMWRAHPDNTSGEAWRDSVEQVAAALAPAERHGVTLAVEPEHANVVCDAAAARRLLDELRSPQLKVVIDAANLVRRGELDAQGETLRRAFDLLGGDLVLAHAKDVRDDGDVVAAGRGGVDFAHYVELLRACGFGGPLILHGLAEAEVPAAAAFLRRVLDQ